MKNLGDIVSTIFKALQDFLSKGKPQSVSDSINVKTTPSVTPPIISDAPSMPDPIPPPPAPTNIGFIICPIQLNDDSGKPLTSRTVKISAVIDHSDTAIDPASKKRWGLHAKDQKVIAFNGEVGDGEPSVGAPLGYMKQIPAPFFSAGEINYVGAHSDGPKAAYYLNYDGHGGYDFPYPKMTPILATADGFLHKLADVEDATYGQGWNIHHTFAIKHDNGFSTCYRHCVKLADDIEGQIGADFTKSCSVKQGQIVAYVGDFGFPGSVHLHFEIRDAQGKMVDPYGDRLWKD